MAPLSSSIQRSKTAWHCSIQAQSKNTTLILLNFRRRRWLISIIYRSTCCPTCKMSIDRMLLVTRLLSLRKWFTNTIRKLRHIQSTNLLLRRDPWASWFIYSRLLMFKRRQRQRIQSYRKRIIHWFWTMKVSIRRVKIWRIWTWVVMFIRNVSRYLIRRSLRNRHRKLRVIGGLSLIL